MTGFCSNHTKAKIGKSLRKLWAERLKWKRPRQKFLQLWNESIAVAAKQGGVDQEELDWDSYEKMKSEIAFIQWAKEKEMASLQAEKTAKERMERKGRLAQKKKEQEEKAKLGGGPKKKPRKSKEEKEELAITGDLKLKDRLMKVKIVEISN